VSMLLPSEVQDHFERENSGYAELGTIKRWAGMDVVVVVLVCSACCVCSIWNILYG
jgi:hypothetical protein